MASHTVHTTVPERHLYKVPEAMALLSLSRSVIYELMRAGRLKFVKVGRATLIPAVAIREYVQTLLAEAESSYDQAS
jgi:excisionase family DNA binding protein